jgi:hypothetical protein
MALIEINWGHRYGRGPLSDVAAECQMPDLIMCSLMTVTGTITWDAGTQSTVSVPFSFTYDNTGTGWSGWTSTYYGASGALSSACQTTENAVDSDLAGAGSSIDVTNSCRSMTQALTDAAYLWNQGCSPFTDAGTGEQFNGTGINAQTMSAFTSTAKDPATNATEALANAKTNASRLKTIATSLKAMADDINGSNAVWGEIKATYYFWGGGNYRALCQEAADRISMQADLAARFPGVVTKH